MDLIPGYAEHEVAERLWVPISYGKFHYFAPMTSTIESWVRLSNSSRPEDGFAAFDITMLDADGNVVAEVERLTLRRTEGQFVMATQPDSGQAEASVKTPGEQALEYNISQGIDTQSGIAAIKHVLTNPPARQIIVSSMDVNALIRQADYLAIDTGSAESSKFDRPELDSEFEAPRDNVETALADLWGKLLGVEGVGIHDSFFDLGGHSLIAVRLFNDIRDQFDKDLPISVLMQSPTINDLGEIIRGGPVGADASATSEASPEEAEVMQFRHVVSMHSGPVGGATPFFMVAGMFGNVLNLSHLAHLLGEERPFYALQARGLYGDTEPHESFEDAARDYIAEIREVQPEGPYLLGGFSGGGLIAYEIARQLISAGETVLRVVMLDTPVRSIPDFSLADKLSMLWQGLKANGIGFFIEKIKNRIQWEQEQRESNAAAPEDPMSFQSQKIGEAFMRSLVRYEVPELDVGVTNLRPKLNIKYRLSNDRAVDDERNYVKPDNGWTPYVTELDIIEVPGNHDSMVLEPNVRVLVSLIRRTIEQAEQATQNAPGKTSRDAA